jgi:hypothetical protein
MIAESEDFMAIRTIFRYWTCGGGLGERRFLVDLILSFLDTISPCSSMVVSGIATKDANEPRSRNNADFWAQKLARNCERDKSVRAQLEAGGWKVAVLWECELRSAAIVEQLLLQYLPIRQTR